MRAATRARGCCCGLWDTHPDVLRDQGLPYGWCGVCEVCGAPGHVRQHPAALPVTVAWCDRHARRIACWHPRSLPMVALAYATALALLTWLGGLW